MVDEPRPPKDCPWRCCASGLPPSGVYEITLNQLNPALALRFLMTCAGGLDFRPGRVDWDRIAPRTDARPLLS